MTFFFYSRYIDEMTYSLFIPEVKQNLTNPIDWSCRIYWLHLCKRRRSPSTTSVLDMTLNSIRWWGFSPGALRNMEYLFITTTLRSTWPREVVSVRVSSMGQIEQNNLLLGLMIIIKKNNIIILYYIILYYIIL